MSRLCVLMLSLFLSGCSPIDDDSVETATDVFLKTVKDSYALAESWLTKQQRDNGLYRYIYYPKTDSYPDKNNAIRQLMVSRLMAEIANERPELKPIVRRNLEFLFKHWYREKDDLGYVFYNSKSKLGANAMMLRTLVWSSEFDKHKEPARKLANGILSLMDDEGALRPWFVEPDYEYDADYLLTFYSGEALVALVEYFEKSKDEKVLSAAIKSQDFYIDRYVTKMKDNYYPAYVPWHTISLNKLYKVTGEKRFADAAFAMNDKLLEILDRTNEVGRFYNPETPEYGKPHSSSDGVFTEGLAYALELAILVDDQKRQSQYKEALRIAIGNLTKLQYNPDRASKFDHPEKILGAFRVNTERSEIRNDTTQHTMDAYRKILQVVSSKKKT